MMTNKKQTSQTITYQHLTRAYHLAAVGVAVWAVAMVWVVAVSWTGTPASADGGATVSGRVTANDAAVAMGKVQVQIFQQGQPPAGPPAQTDASGNFTLSNVTPNSGYQVQIQITDSTYPYLSKTVQNVTVVAGANNVGDIALTTAPKTLTVSVVRDTGAVVANVNVNGFKMGGDFLNTNGMTNTSGVATLHLSGGQWGLNLNAGFVNGQPATPDWVYTGQPLQVTFATDVSSESQSLTITVLTATTTITGKIVYPDGTAAAHIGINLRTSQNGFLGTQTDNAGSFTIRSTAGSYEFSCYLPPDKAQYACPSSSFSISDNETKDFGTMTLSQKTARITGQVLCDGNPVPNVNVSAFIQSNNPGMGGPNNNAQSGSDGTFTLFVNAGTYGVNAWAQPDTNCVSPNGPPTQVTVADNQTVSGTNFTLIKADVTINGIIKDVNGNQVTNFFGFANAMDAAGGFGPGKQFGGPVQNGTFRIKLPSSAMTKATVTVFPPPQGAQYSVKAPATLDIAANQTYLVNLVVAANDSTLSGVVKDTKGNVISDANGWAFMNNENNSQFYNTRIENGHYSFSLLGGSKWHLGYHIEGNFLEQPPSADLISVGAGETVTQNIIVTTSDATIRVNLLDPSGNAIAFGYSFAHPIIGVVSTSGKDLFRGMGGPVRDGVAVIRAVGGLKYGIGAGLPPELSSNNYMSPDEQTVSLAAGQTATVTLKFKTADGSVSGAAKTSTGESVKFGFVGCWSEKGNNTGGPIQNGAYSVNLSKDTIWHCRPGARDNTVFYNSDEFTVTTPNSTGFKLSQDVTLTKSDFVLPQAVIDSVDATQQKIVTLSDGTIITIPSGAFGSSGTFTLTATPTVNLTPSSIAKPLGFGYTLGVTDSTGTAVTTFNSAVTVSFPYDANSLLKRGLTPEELTPKYFDTTTNTWQDVTSSTVDTTNHTITFTTTHFTDFALVTSKSSGSLATVTTGVSTKTGLSYFKVSGKTVTPFTCKGSLRVATNRVSGTQLVAAASSCTGTAKIYNTSGALKKSLTTGWSGVNSVAFTDVTKDGVPDIIVAPMLDKNVEVFNVAKSYAKLNVSINSTKMKLTAKGIDFSGHGKPSLVTAEVVSGVAKNFKIFKYASGAFSLTTSTYSIYLKNSSGSISLSIPKPTVTKLSTSSALKTNTVAKITLTGTNFTPDMTVTISTVTAKVTYVSHTSVTITFNATTLAKAAYALKLKNPGGTTVTTTLKVTIK